MKIYIPEQPIKKHIELMEEVMKLNPQHTFYIVTYKNKKCSLDGSNRLTALNNIGITPRFIELNLEDYVMINEIGNILLSIKKEKLSIYKNKFEDYKDFIKPVRECIYLHKFNNFKNYVEFDIVNNLKI